MFIIRGVDEANQYWNDKLKRSEGETNAGFPWRTKMKDCISFLNNTFWTAMIIGYLLPSVAISKNENRDNENNKKYLERYYSAYITSCFVMERIVIYVYNYILSIYEDFFVIQSGIVLTILLILTGMLIEKFCDLIKVPKKEKENKEFELKHIKDDDKVFIIGVVTLVLAIDTICFNYKVSFLCISLLLGKYFWIDSGLVSIRENYNKIKKNWARTNKQVKKISFRFTYVLLLSNFMGNMLHKKFNIDSYLFSMYIAILLIGINIFCSLKKRKS